MTDCRNEAVPPVEEISMEGNSKGIDIRQALSILSSRREETHAHNHDHEPGCCHGTPAPEHAKTMGQTIDLLASTSSSSTEEATVQQLKEQAKQQAAQMEQELQRLTHQELLQALFRAQQDRVQTYQSFERACQVVLQTGNLTSYPPACAQATASFCVLSETMQTIAHVLQERGRPSEAQLVRDLQRHEKDKLQWTAAYHLERIRYKNEAQDQRIGSLLTEGVASLKQKLATCVEEINDVLEELRCHMLDGDEE